MLPSPDEQSLLQTAFPGRDTVIGRAYRDNPAFRELCQDYRKCALALERWSRLDGGDAASRTLEYTELLAELTSEIESWLGQGSTAPEGKETK